MVPELLSRSPFNNPALLRTALECEKRAKRSERIDHRFVAWQTTNLSLSEAMGDRASCPNGRRSAGGLVLTVHRAAGGAIGSEFLPHLDERALWVRCTLAPSTGPSEGIRAMNQSRILLCSRMTGPIRQAFQYRILRGFETKGTVAAWIPRGQGQLDRGHESRSQYHAVGGFSQPTEDNTEEAVSRVKGEPSTRRVSEEYLGEFFEGGLGEQLGFAEAGGVILFAANADAEDGVAPEDVEGSDKAADPESFLA